MDPINPAVVRKMPGRPKKMRKRLVDAPRKDQASMSKELTTHCKRCFQPNNNARICKNPIHPKSKFHKVYPFSN